MVNRIQRCIHGAHVRITIRHVPEIHGTNTCTVTPLIYNFISVISDLEIVQIFIFVCQFVGLNKRIHFESKIFSVVSFYRFVVQMKNKW